MTVRDVMTANPTCCTQDTPLQDVAQMMVTCDCGEIAGGACLVARR